ncbi:MAG: TraB/GumN family protein [Paracoccaceae bacterium]
MIARMVSYAACLWLAGLVVPGDAEARCRGTDLMAELARQDPAAHNAILDAAAEVPNGEGIFWQVARPDSPETAPSYLLGTLHSTAAAARGLPAPVAEALDRARVLLVEISAEEKARMQARMTSDPTFAFATGGPTLSERLGPDVLPIARRALASRGVPLAIADRMKPALVVSMIALPACELANLRQGARVLDEAVIAIAETAGTPVQGLETVDAAFAAFDALSEAEMTQLLTDGFRAIDAEEDLRATLEELYAAERIAAIMEFNIWFSDSRDGGRDTRASAEALERTLLAERNRLWLPAILAEMSKGGVLVAVGALHMTGRHGLVALLRAKGYEVERVALGDAPAVAPPRPGFTRPPQAED